MSNLNLKVNVAKDRRVTFQLPEDVEPGEVRLTVVVHPQRKPKKTDDDFDFPTLHLKEWPKEWGTLRREDLYGDDGR